MRREERESGNRAIELVVIDESRQRSAANDWRISGRCASSPGPAPKVAHQTPVIGRLHKWATFASRDKPLMNRINTPQDALAPVGYKRGRDERK